MSEFPEVFTHNYDPARGACRNLCTLAAAGAEAILDDIRASGKRTIKANYLQRRLATEDWLICESRRKLGSVQLERPVYFFLGDFADGLDQSRPQSLVMALAAFSPGMLTFTYGDSMASFPGAAKPNHLTRDYHGTVFDLDEIRDVVARFGMPSDRWKTDPSMLYAKFIEVQVWDDRPIRQALAKAGGSSV
jgi:hypothetical protein